MTQGWKVVIALFLAGVVVYGGGLYCFVLFVTPLTDEFHWTRAQTGGMVSAFWLTAPLIVFGGYFTERFGARKLLVAGVLLEALCVALLSTVGGLWQMYLLRAAMGFGKLLFAITIPVTLSAWFTRGFSLALGIAWAGWHVGGMVLSPVVAAIIDRFGWRGACLALAAGLVAIGLLPILWAVRTPSTQAGNAPEPMERERFRLGTVLRAPVFWLIALATLFFYTTYGGLLAHQAAIVEAAGYSLRTASLVLGLTAAFAAFGAPAIGWALDRFRLTPSAVALHGLLLAGAVLLLLIGHWPSMAALVVYAACFGTMIGASDVFFVALMRRAFPGVAMSHLYSVWYCVELSVLFASPIAAGWIFDLSGGYRATLLVLTASAALAGLATTAAMLRTRARAA